MPASSPRGPQPVPLGRPAARGHPLFGEVKRRQVAPLVVGDAGHAGVGKLARGDHVAAAHRERVQAERPGRLLHDPLHDQDDLRTGDAAVGSGRGLVGGDGPAPGPVGRDLVDARQLARRHQRLDGGGERERRVGADVAVDVRGQAQDAAVGVERRPHLVALLVAVERGGQVLAAVLDPGDRPAQPHRGRGDHHFLPADHALEPEPAADVGRDHPDPALGDPERLGDAGPDLVRDLGRHVRDQLVVAVVPFGHAGPALQRQRGHPGAGERAADDDRRGGEDARQRRALEHGQVHHAVAGQLLVDLPGAVRRGRLDAGDGRPRRPVDVQQFGGVLGEVGIVGQHHRDRLAGEAHLVAGQHRHRRGHELVPLEHRSQERTAQVRRGEHGGDAGQLQRGGGVDRAHRGRGERAARERRVQHPRPGEVAGEPAPAGQHPAVFLARQRGAHPASRRRERRLRRPGSRSASSCAPAPPVMPRSPWSTR